MFPAIDHLAFAAADRAQTRGFLFTDIVGSTEIAERLGDEAFAHFLDLHDTLVQSQARLHGALELHFLGDGFLLVFADARAALDCAAAIQRAAAAQRAADGAPLFLRLGVNAGPAQRRGNTFVGRNVILARRLCDQAEPDEVLVSERLRELAGTIADRFGTSLPRQLKGLTGTEPACALRWC